MMLPTEKLVIRNVDEANDEIRAFAAELVVKGKRPWFEVWYPKTTAATFDAVEVDDDGTITTLPPYSELVG